MSVDFRAELNEEQYRAVTAGEGPLLVLAAAGTGKTRTLVYRVAYLVEQGISPDRILLLTFTNRAANEMLDRATALTGAGIGGLWGGTFHHIANLIGGNIDECCFTFNCYRAWAICRGLRRLACAKLALA